MKLFDIFKKKKPVQFPKITWNDLTVEDLFKIKDIEGLQLSSDDEKNLMVAALLAGIDYEEIVQMPLETVRAYMDNTEFLLHEPKPIKAKRYYMIRGRKYKLLKNEMDMIVSQYIDFQAIYKDGFEKRPGELLSVMLVPEGHTYNDGYDKEQVVEDMYQMHVEEALGIIDFFIRRFIKLIIWTKMYYKVMGKIMILKTPKKDKEMMKATVLQMNLVLDELNSMYGLIASQRYHL